MTTITIDLPDQQAAALQAKAAAQGLTLEDLVRKLAEHEAAPAEHGPVTPQEAATRIREIRTRTKPDPEGWTIKDYINYGRRQMADLVIEASVATAWCFKDETTPYTEGVLTAISTTADALAPRLWAYELRNSVLMGVRRRRITKADAQAFLQSLPALRLRLADPPSYDDVFQLAERHSLTVYDAACLDLALREGLPLASLDAALVRAAQTVGVAMFQP